MENELFVIEDGCLTACDARAWHVRVPKTVKEIGANVFRDIALSVIALPDGLRRIGDSAFANCRELKQLRIPDSVDEIAPYAFSYSSLRELTLPHGLREIPTGMCSGCAELTQIAVPQGVRSIGERAFARCTKLKTVYLPQGLREIGEGAFAGCTALESIVIPSGVRKIVRGTFNNCSSMDRVTISETVTLVDAHAFAGCDALEEFEVDKNNPNYYNDEAGALITKSGTLVRYPYAGAQTEYTPPTGVRSIAFGAFENCTMLRSVTVPDSVVKIGAAAFCNCKKLERVYIGACVREIGSAAFAFSPRLRTVHFGGGIKKLPDSLFCRCGALTDVKLPYDLVELGRQVFDGCRSLERIELPEKLTRIGEQCFYGCSKLEALTLPLRVKTLRDSVFFGCRSLKTIRLPSALKSIEAGAFGRCTALKTVYFGGDEERRQKIDIDRSYNKRVLETQWVNELDAFRAVYAAFREQRDWDSVHPAEPASKDEQARGGICRSAILGVLVGDAVGVPFESGWRDTFTATDMVDLEHGVSTCHQESLPIGTWSDDGCLTLATLDHLRHNAIEDTQDLMRRFCAWYFEDKYTPGDQKRFGEGQTTTRALQAFMNGTRADECGSDADTALTNGSLMRILPLALFPHAAKDIAAFSALTHAHPLAIMACVCYVEIAEKLIEGRKKEAAVQEIRWPECAVFSRMAKIGEVPRDDIRSSAHVIETLEAALWCFLTTDNYRDCILTAVNLGRDTDTIAAVAGGLAGIYYTGEKAIPTQWIRNLQPGYEPYIRF